MITFTGHGVWVDDSDWASAKVSESYVRIRFLNGAEVSITRELLEHATELLKASDKRRSTHAKENDRG